jgi:hypothetical protein
MTLSITTTKPELSKPGLGENRNICLRLLHRLDALRDSVADLCGGIVHLLDIRDAEAGQFAAAEKV